MYRNWYVFIKIPIGRLSVGSSELLSAVHCHVHHVHLLIPTKWHEWNVFKGFSSLFNFSSSACYIYFFFHMHFFFLSVVYNFQFQYQYNIHVEKYISTWYEREREFNRRKKTRVYIPRSIASERQTGEILLVYLLSVWIFISAVLWCIVFYLVCNYRQHTKRIEHACIACILCGNNHKFLATSQYIMLPLIDASI